jgi:hypothetical protein
MPFALRKQPVGPTLGLDFALGSPTDRLTTRWEELFLPSELHDALARATRQQAGERRALVRGERVLLTASRPPPPSHPPSRLFGFGVSGLLLGALLAGLGALRTRSRAARWSFAGLTFGLGLALGLLGCVSSWFWAFSRHWSAYRNWNLLLSPPWALALCVLAVGVATQRQGASRYARRLVELCLASSAVAVGLGFFPGLAQANLRIAALLLPIWAGLWVGLRRTA